MNIVQENAVVTAENFNVTLFRQLWLIENNIIKREEFDGSEAIFTPPLVQVSTAQFAFVAVEDRVQFVPRCDEQHKQALIVERLGQLVALLPHTPYTAMGLNFVWHFVPDGQDTIRQIGQHLFFREGTAIAQEFSSADAKYGGYYSKNAFGFRLKLTTTPVDIQRQGQPELFPTEVMQFAFNYHLASRHAAEIVASLSKWDEAKQHATNLIQAIESSI